MANPDTDLLGAHRRKSILYAVLALGALVGLGVLGWYVLGTEDKAATKPVVTTPTPDAAPRPPEPPDANESMSKEDITAISRFGYLTIKSNIDDSKKLKTSIYIDGQYIGTTPMTRLPLAPGPHKIKAVGPKNKTKMMDTTILGGQDTDEGTIVW